MHQETPGLIEGHVLPESTYYYTVSDLYVSTLRVLSLDSAGDERIDDLLLENRVDNKLR